MAVVEELIALIGFKVEGAGELKAADSLLLRFRKRLADVGSALNRTLSRVGSGAGSVLGRFTASLKSSVSTAAVMVSTLARLALVAAGTAAAIASIVGVLAKLAHAYAKARAEAALMRREEQFKAAGKRTTSTNIDKLGRGFTAIGLKDEQAEKLVGEIAKQADDAIREGGDDNPFKKNKIPILDKKGNQLDTTGVARDAIKAYLDRQQQAKALREKGRPADIKKANALERSNRGMAYDLKFSDEIKGALAALSGWAEFERRMTEANNQNPTASKKDIDRENALGDRWIKVANDLEGVLNGISTHLGRVGMTIEETILPPLEAFASGLNSVARAMGLISETKDAKEARQEQERETSRAKSGLGRQTPDIAGALREAGAQRGNAGVLEWLFGGPIDQSRQRLVTAADRYESAKRNETAGIGMRRPEAQSKFEEMTGKAAGELLAALSEWKSMTAPQAATQNLPMPQPRPNIENVGNDQRTINTSVTVNATGLEAIGAAAASGAQKGVLGAASTKANLSSTGALTDP